MMPLYLLPLWANTIWFSLGEPGFGELSSATNLMSFLLVLFPAVGSALTGIRLFGEHERNAERYSRMHRFLKRMDMTVKETEDIESLVASVLEMEDAILDENREWVRVLTPNVISIHA